MLNCCFFDLEIDPETEKILSVGAVLTQWPFQGQQQTLQTRSPYPLKQFSQGAHFILGHNIFNHDLRYLPPDPLTNQFFESHQALIDTLYLSSLLFANKPYHHLVKDYQLLRSIPPDPLKDAQLVQRLFADCLERFFSLQSPQQEIYFNLLKGTREYQGFCSFITSLKALPELSPQALFLQIHAAFRGRLCIQSDFLDQMRSQPVVLAFALAIADTLDQQSIIPPWILHTHPQVQETLQQLRNIPCQASGCEYCRTKLDPHLALKKYFDYQTFRDYEGAPLQEDSIQAALRHESVMTIFPTGGGKSLTFQLPALMQGESLRGLTVVISPLQSLMKDQVDVLKERFEIFDVATLNGLQDPAERQISIAEVESGQACLLYISPEALRSRTILSLLKKRQISRFVIDEAHCFSSWGQNLRVDYLYIGPYLRMLQTLKGLPRPIPVSCFTATARQNVIADIQAYFKQHLELELREISTRAQRKNLHFEVWVAESEADKLTELRKLLDFSEGTAIVFISTTTRATQLAEKLSRFYPGQVQAYHGKMKTADKLKIQDQFMQGEIRIIVATSAFGMGVDKDDVTLVVHYDIPDSLESYLQEAGRAGRNPKLEARCCLLYCEADLRTQFNLLNSSKISQKEINQIWRAVKQTKKRKFHLSAQELARAAGWEEELKDLETRIRAALSILEEKRYLERGLNHSLLIFDYFTPQSPLDLNQKLAASPLFQDEKDRETAKRILQLLISRAASYAAQAKAGEIYSFDNLCHELSLEKHQAVRILNAMRQLGLVHARQKDLLAASHGHSAEKDSKRKYQLLSAIEKALAEIFAQRSQPVHQVSLKSLNYMLSQEYHLAEASIDAIRRLLRYWHTRGWIEMRRIKKETQEYQLTFIAEPARIRQQVEQWHQPLADIVQDLYARSKKQNPVEFTLEELPKQDSFFAEACSLPQIDQLLRYLHTLGIFKIETGLTVIQTRMSLERLEQSSQKQFTRDDYKSMEEYYLHKIEQIHIISNYARKMRDNYQTAMQFIDDYFSLPFAEFLQKNYPRHSERKALKRPLLPAQFEAIFGALSAEQNQIMQAERGNLLVVAGPGSGKTRVLVHKVASLLLLEDVKPEQFLMLTFSRPAAQEIKQRLRALVGAMASYLDVFTYHSYAFHLLERPGQLEGVDTVVQEATERLKSQSLAGRGVKHKSVLLVDEYQDISPREYDFLQAIVAEAEDIRLIVVGDDDQNIYAFRGASVEYMQRFANEHQAAIYFLQTNFRSRANLVDFSNQYIRQLPRRMKQSQDLVAHQSETGRLEIHQHVGEHLYQPLLESLIKSQRQGSVAVLTATNEEALLMQTLLQQSGLPARLITSLQNFKLKNLLELRLFNHLLLRSVPGDLGLIPAEQWQESKAKMRQQCARSLHLNLVQLILTDFEQQQPQYFLSDWFQYLDQIKLEEFFSSEQGEIFVSTMHKAKGKEFDQVFLLLNHFDLSSDERKRVLYVAMTRARQKLVIHTNTLLFEGLQAEGLTTILHQQRWPQPQQLRLQTGIGDIYLGHVKKQQEALRQAFAGDRLTPETELSLKHPEAGFQIRFSRQFQEQLQRIQARGYQLNAAHVAWMVVWFDKNEQREYRVPLPELNFSFNSRS